jgi:hypothetical protein
MKTYEVVIKYTAYHNTTVEAKDKEEAESIALDEAENAMEYGEFETLHVEELT